MEVSVYVFPLTVTGASIGVMVPSSLMMMESERVRYAIELICSNVFPAMTQGGLFDPFIFTIVAFFSRKVAVKVIGEP